MTSPISSVSGLISGISTSDLVDQIIASESLPAQRAKDQSTALTAKVTALKTYQGLLDALKASAVKLRDGTAFESVSTTASNTLTAAGKTILSASAASTAAPGSYSVQVDSLAQAEKLSGSIVTSTTAPLGLTGDFFVNGAHITVDPADALGDIRTKIQNANAGASPSHVSSSILTNAGGSRLILTSDQQGASGIDLVDGPQGVLQQLGFVDGTTTLKHATSAGTETDRFASSSSAVGTLLGLSGLGPQTVTIGGQSVSIDLSVDTLDAIATKLNALAGVTATVQTETTAGTTRSYLDVRAPSGLTDAGHTLEMLGLLEGGRSSISQVLAGGALTAGDATTPATAATALTSLWNGGASANVQAGDTFTISGMRGDGTAVNLTYTVAAGDTLQQVLDQINDATTGFGAGTRPATASIDAQGRIAITDGTAGDSRLALSIVAGNQGGGRADLGRFTTQQFGRARTLIAGSDAQFTVDGVSLTRSTNTITDAIADVTLTLQNVSAGQAANIVVERSPANATGAMKDFVDAYNGIVDFIKTQNTAGVNGAANPVLFNDTSLRQGRSSLPQLLLATINGATTGLSTASTAGLSLQLDGKLALDEAKFSTAFTTRYDDLRQLFMERGTSSNSSLTFVSSSGQATGGSYAVDVTSPATRASISGVMAGGTYVDDGTPDSLIVTETASGARATISLANGMTASEIAQALTDAFATAAAHTIASGAALFSDPAGTTPALATTTFANLTAAGGGPAGVAASDTISFSGLRPDGTSYSGIYTVSDPATATLGSLTSAIQGQIGAAATVSIVNGRLTVSATQAGSSPMTFSVTSGNQGGGALDFGGTAVTQQGRTAMNLTASAAGNALTLGHAGYGAAAGFSVAFAAGGADGSASLGIGAGSWTGTDVVGTINGVAATGSGQQLLGIAGTPTAGLVMQYSGTAAGSGTVGVVVGVGAQIERMLDSWTGTGGTLLSKEASLEQQAARLDDKATVMTARLERRRANLLKQYAAMETALAKLKQQSASILALANQNSSSSNSSGQ